MNGKIGMNRALRVIAQLSIDKSSQVLSKLVRGGARIAMEDSHLADISQVTERIGKNNDEVVGTFIDLKGDVGFKFLFFVKPEDSFILADLMLRRAPGTTKEFDIYAQSAVQEIGNILASAISNVFSTDFQISINPTPPTVIHDYAGTVFDEYILRAAKESNEIFIIESKFEVVKHYIDCHMFIVPVADSEKILSYIVNTL